MAHSDLALRLAGALLVCRDPSVLCGLLGLDPEPDEPGRPSAPANL
ncbi:hypothetical protein [Streptomyces sp. NPDC058653]